MTRRCNSLPFTLTMFFAAALLVPSAARAQGPRLQLDHLNRLTSQAKENVDVTVDPAMLQQMAGFFTSTKKDSAALQSMIAGLKGVYVKVFEFDKPGVYTAADVEAVRSQLKSPWTRLVSVKGDGENVEVHMWQEGGESGGLAVLVAGTKELVVVNIVGKVDLRVLSALQGQLGIPSGLGLTNIGQTQSKKEDKKED